jgi:hypothetical protein
MYDKYDGIFHESKFNGYGRLFFLDGSLFTGKFTDNLRQGSGKMDYPSDDRLFTSHEGLYSKDTKNGKGTLLYKNGNHFSGNFNNNLPNGYGTLTFTGADWENPFGCYEGGFYCGYFSGSGKMVFKNGDTYEGGWKNNVFDGFGKFRKNIALGVGDMGVTVTWGRLIEN